MTIEEQKAINSLLREQLLDLSLRTKNKALFEKMTSENWVNYIVGENDHIPEPVEKEKEVELSYLQEEFFEYADASIIAWERYLNDTTLTDGYLEKRERLEELKMLSYKLNANIYTLISTILDNHELVQLLTLTTDKTYRNGVFYMDDSSDKVLLKDNRIEVQNLGVFGALEYYAEKQIPFFIEIQAAHRMEEGLKEN